jgi:hypothetical protein
MYLFEELINHPGRKLTLQYIYYICIAATPPSKGGETYFNISCNYDYAWGYFEALQPTKLV